jgi:hypothetical protein
MKHKIIIAMVATFLALVTVSFAQELVVYPNESQSSEQQEKDKFECYSWAKGDSGFDPMALPTASEPPPEKEAAKGGTGKGLARGAVAGLAVGAIAGDSKSDKRKATKVGAAGGAVVGTARRNDQKKGEEKKQKDWEQQQTQQYAQNRNNYNRAYSACLEGRNYSVK